MCSKRNLMDSKELETILVSEGIKPSSYSLTADFSDPDEALCLRKESDKWVVYYSERGLQTGKEFFNSEPEACTRMLEELRSDPTTKKDWKSGFSM